MTLYLCVFLFACAGTDDDSPLDTLPLTIPDLTGIWELDIENSDRLPPLSVPGHELVTSEILVIAHQDAISTRYTVNFTTDITTGGIGGVLTLCSETTIALHDGSCNAVIYDVTLSLKHLSIKNDEGLRIYHLIE